MLFNMYFPLKIHGTWNPVEEKQTRKWNRHRKRHDDLRTCTSNDLVLRSSSSGRRTILVQLFYDCTVAATLSSKSRTYLVTQLHKLAESNCSKQIYR